MSDFAVTRLLTEANRYNAYRRVRHWCYFQSLERWEGA